jgi:hypothetical protein
MQVLMKTFSLILLPLFIGLMGHKFYVSVTNVEYSDKDKAIQITSRIFIDDLEKALEERYGFEALLGTPEENKKTDVYLEKYLRAKFALKINGRVADYNFLGKKVENDLVICFIEILNEPLEKVSSLEVQNEILMDVFEEQKNIVHLKMGGKKKSFILIRESNKGMLNF